MSGLWRLFQSRVVTAKSTLPLSVIVSFGVAIQCSVVTQLVPISALCSVTLVIVGFFFSHSFAHRVLLTQFAFRRASTPLHLLIRFPSVVSFLCRDIALRALKS